LITHHELCFGCGQANLFGLQLEVSRDGDRVSGRFFAKQDHQGPPGVVHGGIVTTALDEAMALLVHDSDISALTRRLEVDLLRPAPIGTFLNVTAWFSDELTLEAELEAEGQVLARARGVFVRARTGD
jgi:acyl-coenzyme A thioesterase PaaI-like protein